MNSNNNTFYVTTAIDYASGNPHLGHAYEKIGADVLARWNRLIQHKTFFLTGTDEHGQKIKELADKENITPKEFVDSKVKQFIELTKVLDLSNDFFIRTTDENHKTFVQNMLQKSFDNGDIYLGEYSGLYCVGCEKYYAESDLIDGKICPDHKREVQTIKEENYFFKLSKYQNKLLDLYEQNQHFISPEHRKKEILNRVKEGLEDISISRPKSSLEWGIELPFDSNHVTYVWFDALFNYLSAVQDSMEFWPADVHIIGKDIMWFHMVYWPAFLMSVDEDLPKKVHAHGMILDKDGHKMSKSLGNVIDPFEQIKTYGLEEFKYYVMSMGGFGEDLNYSEEIFVEKINNELNNDYGNLVSRVHSMIQKYCGGVIPTSISLTSVEESYLKKLELFENVSNYMDSLEFHKAIEEIFTAIRECNAYINAVEPWKEKDQERLNTIMNILAKSVVVFSSYLSIVMPQKTKIALKQFGFEQPELDINAIVINENHSLNEKQNLFSKVKFKKQEQSENNNNSSKHNSKTSKKKNLESIAELRLQVGKILSVKQHPNAEKLYIEEIDVGEEQPRQIISGLKDYFEKEELLGKNVIVVTNLKPAKLRGELSQGMVLLAENDKGELGFLTSNAKPGSFLQTESGELANSSEEITIDTFFTVPIISKGTHIEIWDKKIITQEDNVVIENNIVGKVR
jgi:methionyl-tRNA synthetase